VPTASFNLDFPDDKSRDDFMAAFRGWLKQYQQTAGLARALTGGQSAGGQQTGASGGLQAGQAQGEHVVIGGPAGGQGTSAGLFSLGGGSAQVGPYGGSVQDLYLNFIGGW
jgi:hypothetical protein